MLEAAAARVYTLLKDVWPSGVQLLDPDDKVDFEVALGPVAGSTVVVRYYQPQLFGAAEFGRCTAFVDVCARRLSTARTAAQLLLSEIPTTPRSPNGLSEPRAVPIQESSYWRVHVTFTVIVDAIPEPIGS